MPGALHGRGGGLHGDPPGALPNIGPYRLLGRAGRGALATVFRAVHAQAGTPVAIKLLHASLSHDPECRARLALEARALARLAHPHTVALHGTGEVDGRPYLVLGWVGGQPLTALLAQGQRWTAGSVAALVHPLAQALAQAHARGVVHRDIKPANVVWQAGPGAGRLVLVDFGTALLTGDAAAAALEPTAGPGRVLGSPRHMAPEQRLGGPVDGRCDLFALAGVMALMLWGRLPPAGAVLPPAGAVLPTDPAATGQGADAGDTPGAALADVVARCRTRLPEQRLPTANALAALLQPLLPAPPLSPPLQPQRPPSPPSPPPPALLPPQPAGG